MREGEEKITYFARSRGRDGGRLFGIKRRDRRAHMLIIGKTGVGKSTLLETFVRHDISTGEGVAFFDPHGDSVEKMRSFIPEERKAVYLNLADPTLRFRFNPLSNIPAEKQPLAAANLVEIFRKVWSDSWGPRSEHVLRNSILALLEYGGGTIADIPRLFAEKNFRSSVTSRLKNQAVRSFWTEEFERYPYAMRAQVTSPLLNKLGAFLSDPRIYRFLASPGENLRLSELMDQGGILLVNLSKGEVGEGPASLIGSLLVASIGLAGLAQAKQAPDLRRDFYIYLDEYPSFATLSLAGMLSELRKYRVSLILAQQYLSQVETEIRDAVLGNVGTLIAFRVGPQDVGVLVRELAPEFDAEDILRLPNFRFYIRLLIDGAVSRPFSAETMRLDS